VSYSLGLGKRNDEENAKEKLFTYATHVPVTTFKVTPTCMHYISISNITPSLGSSDRRRRRRIDILPTLVCSRCNTHIHFQSTLDGS
jgi:hypothetical protein